MTPLPSQEFFESLIAKDLPHEPLVIVRFTASWCVPCQRLDTSAIVEASKGVTWYVCDLDENDYTPGYCGIKTIPAFLAIINGKVQPVFQSSKTNEVIDWIRKML